MMRGRQRNVARIVAKWTTRRRKGARQRQFKSTSVRKAIDSIKEVGDGLLNGVKRKVTLPRGANVGQRFVVRGRDGQSVDFKLPGNLKPGQRFEVTIPFVNGEPKMVMAKKKCFGIASFERHERQGISEKCNCFVVAVEPFGCR